MKYEKLYENAKRIMTTRGWHYNQWSSKCQAFFSIYQAITEAKYPIKSVLNIGVGPNMESKDKNIFMKTIWPSIETFDNLEISNKTAKMALNDPDPIINRVTIGDVRVVDELFKDKKFDLIFWNQGPEHVYRNEWADCFKRLRSICSAAIYIHTPWGSGYDYDVWHFSKSIRRGEFEQFGFSCFYHGKEDTKDAGIMGYQFV